MMTTAMQRELFAKARERNYGPERTLGFEAAVVQMFEGAEMASACMERLEATVAAASVAAAAAAKSYRADGFPVIADALDAKRLEIAETALRIAVAAGVRP